MYMACSPRELTRTRFSVSSISPIPPVIIAVVVKHTHKHLHKPVHSDVDECAKDNGGCDSKRKCTNSAGSFNCEDCDAGYVNDGAKGCKGLYVSASVCVCVCVFA